MNLAKTAADEITHSHTREMPDGSVLDILKLIEQVKNRQSESVALSNLQRPSRSPREGFSHKRYSAVDVTKPMLITGDAIIDGRHRYFRLQDAGMSHAPAIRVTPEDLSSVNSVGRPSVQIRIALGS